MKYSLMSPQGFRRSSKPTLPCPLPGLSVSLRFGNTLTCPSHPDVLTFLHTAPCNCKCKTFLIPNHRLSPEELTYVDSTPFGCKIIAPSATMLGLFLHSPLTYVLPSLAAPYHQSPQVAHCCLAMCTYSSPPAPTPATNSRPPLGPIRFFFLSCCLALRPDRSSFSQRSIEAYPCTRRIRSSRPVCLRSLKRGNALPTAPRRRLHSVQSALIASKPFNPEPFSDSFQRFIFAGLNHSTLSHKLTSLLKRHLTRRLFHQTRNFLLQRNAQVPWAWQSTPALFDALHCTPTKVIPSFTRLAIVRWYLDTEPDVHFRLRPYLTRRTPCRCGCGVLTSYSQRGCVQARSPLRISHLYIRGVFSHYQILLSSLNAFSPLPLTPHCLLPNAPHGPLGANPHPLIWIFSPLRCVSY